MPLPPEVRRVLERARRSLLQLLGGGLSPGPSVPAAGVTLTEVLPLLYPDVADVAGLAAAARAAVGTEVLTSTGELRRLLGALDRQAYPSPVTVRFRRDDLTTTQLSDFRLITDQADASVSAYVAHDKAYEPHVTAVVSQYCKPGTTAFDIGANIGYYTVLLSRLVGHDGCVYSFEPNSENLRMILATLDANSVTNVTLLPTALDAQRGWAYFTSHVGSNGGLLREGTPQFVEGGGWIVPTASLDSLFDGDVDLIKIDVEGGEGRVVAGATQTLQRCRPVVISEFSCEMLPRVSNVEPLAYLESFARLGYQIHVIDRAEPGRVGPAVTPSELLGHWGSALRVEDLLFLPS